MASEHQTRRQVIDGRLAAAGWRVVPHSRWADGDRTPADAVEEYPTDAGPGDYLLFLDDRPVADVEAKRPEVHPENVIEQAKRYSRALADSRFQFGDFRIPFAYATNGPLIYTCDLRDSLLVTRQIAAFHTPEALRESLARDAGAADLWLRGHPITDPDRPYQQGAIAAIETGLRNGKRRMMVAMATGSGKTRMAISAIYRLMKSGHMRRVLFLVDRRALAAQAVATLAAYEPEPGLKFDRIYEVYSQRFKREDLEDEEEYRFDPTLLPDTYLTQPDSTKAFVYVSTIQRMRINLFGPPDDLPWPDQDDERDAARVDIPIHAFDLVIADECHRGYTASEASKWREVLEHFDSVIIGLTATPAAHTTAFFDRPIYEYGYRRAVAEGYLVDYEAVDIHSEITMHGHFLQEGEEVGLQDVQTGQFRFEFMEDERELPPETLTRDWTAPDRDRKIVAELARHLRQQENLTGRFPKTLIFAENDLPHRSHADQLVRFLRQEFGRGDDFVQKITGAPNVDRPLQLIRRFRNRPEPAIVVTVDMLSTGVDIPWLENVVFLRPVKSRVLFEQMLGRGTRRSEEIHKTHFTVFDAVGVLEYFRKASEFTFDPPARPTRPIGDIVEAIYNNEDRDYNLRLLVRRLQRIAKQITGEGRQQLAEFIPDGDIEAFARGLPARLERDWAGTMRVLRDERFQDLLVTYPRAQPTFIIAHEAEDTVTSEVVFRTADGRELRPEGYLEAFHRFIGENRSHVEALQILLERPADWRSEPLKQLRRALEAASERFSETSLRKAYRHPLADIISMVHHADRGDPLLTAEQRVNRALGRVLEGLDLTPEQQRWIDLIRRHLITNLAIERQDFELLEFAQQGATWGRVDRAFGGRLEELIADLNRAVAE